MAPFQDPHPGSTQSDSLVRRFQELELPDPYIWLYTTASFAATTATTGVNATRIAWSTCSTRFDAVGFNPNVSTLSPVVPEEGLYSVSLKVNYGSSASPGFIVVQSHLFRVPYNSTTPQQLSRIQDVKTMPGGGSDLGSHTNVVFAPLQEGDQLFATIYGLASTGFNYAPLTVNPGEEVTSLIVAGIGQARRAYL